MPQKKMTPAQQSAWDEERSTAGILLDHEGNVIFDGEAEAAGTKPFKNLAEIKAQRAKLEAELDAHAERSKDIDYKE